MKLEDYIDEYLQEITATGKSPKHSESVQAAPVQFCSLL